MTTTSHHHPHDPGSTATPPLPAHAEVVVVGAGFAGLSAALTLGRAQRQVLVLGAGPTRNAETLHSHNLLTREGASPGDLLATAVAEVRAQPTATVQDAHVRTIVAADPDAALGEPAVAPGRGRLAVTTADGQVVTADAVVLATGVRDALPDVPGLVELWGSRAHSCPFCDAGLYPGRRLAVLADPPAADHLDTLLSGWTADRVVVAPADVDEVVLAPAGPAGSADPDRAPGEVGEEGRDVLLRLRSGAVHRVDGVFVGATPRPRSDAVDGLALDRRGPFLAVDGEGRTSVPGLWAVGDIAWADGAAFPGGQVVQAMADGSVAAISIIVTRTGITRPPAPERVPNPPAAADPTPDPAAIGEEDAVAFWEDRYRSAERVWSGRPSRAAVEALADLRPGRALELGCGEGADAIWLAEQGWQVTAVDLSATALTRAAAAAERRGVADRITWVEADLAAGLPDAVLATSGSGGYDAVLAAHLLSPLAFPRDAVLRAAADAVAPGGTLVVLSHLHPPAGSWHGPAHHDVDLPDVEEQVRRLALDAGWDVARAEAVDVRFRTPDGTVATRRDSVVVVRRAA